MVEFCGVENVMKLELKGCQKTDELYEFLLIIVKVKSFLRDCYLPMDVASFDASTSDFYIALSFSIFCSERIGKY